MRIYDVKTLVISLVMVTVLGLLVGCAPQTASDITHMPYTELNFPSSPNVSDPTPQRKTTTKTTVSDSTHKWASRSNRPWPWKYIVIHHSATNRGNSKLFDKMHRRKGWDEMGYHFVIDNGNGGPDGKVEIGSRWRKQKWGAHTKTANNEYNNFGIGICLVGNFMNRMPSARQLESMRQLVKYLMVAHDIPPQNVIAHKDAPVLKKTECCGRKFHRYVHSNSFRRQLHRYSMTK